MSKIVRGYTTKPHPPASLAIENGKHGESEKSERKKNKWERKQLKNKKRKGK